MKNTCSWWHKVVRLGIADILVTSPARACTVALITFVALMTLSPLATPVTAQYELVGCGTVYDVWRWNQYDEQEIGHGATSPHGWNTSIGFANVKAAHDHETGMYTLDHTWFWNQSHTVCN